MDSKLTRKYSDNLPKKKYVSKIFRTLPSLKWGQRKLLITEIDFLTRYYDDYRKGEKKYLLYVGASPGIHINYLNFMFPDINYILYDKAESLVDKMDNVVFHRKYFDDNEAKKYAGMNLFFICDIRTLTIGKHLKKMRTLDESSDEFIQNEEKTSEIVFDDMKSQKVWCDIMKPIQSHLKFRVSWSHPVTEYYDGDVYFQPWTGNGSIEMRIVPKLNTLRVWNNKTIEEVCFYYNIHTRRKKINGKYHETLLEEQILREYISKFMTNNNIEDTVSDMSISISVYLLSIIKRKSKIDPGFLHDVSIIMGG